MIATLTIALVFYASVAPTSSSPDPYALERARAAVIRSALAKVRPSIVMIETIGGAQPIRQDSFAGPSPESFRVADGPTTGLVLSGDGLIITSSFNFARDPSVITVLLDDGRRAVAKLLGRDHIRRLALLKIDETDLPVPEWAPSDEILPGQFAIACGRGLGGDEPFVSLGMISALRRRNANAIQTDAKISPINYGGPLIDIDGRVMGILVPMAGAGGALAGAEWYDSGIGFAIYKDKIDLVFDRLAGGQDIEQGKIGVVLVPDDDGSLLPFLDKLFPASKGVRIERVLKNSPASRADLREDDRILAIDGQPTGDLLELQRRLSDRAAGEEITLTVKRRWRTLAVKVKLAPTREIGISDESTEPEGDEDDEPTSRPESD